ncbi:MAG: ABC transporter permease [Chloroflexota bacterium]|nr:ABC transporter permease [Chloroflexota bacterium]
MAAGGLAIFGIIATWVFGREYSDRTVKDFLALLTAREAIVAAKLVVVAVWSSALAVWVILLTLILGTALALPGGSPTELEDALRTVAEVVVMTILVLAPFAWVASAGRGYLPPVATLLFVLAVGQLLGVLGWAAYFPWSIALLVSGAAGPDAALLGPESYMSVFLAASIGIMATLLRWRYADHT